MKKGSNEIYIILDNIRSSHNVGSIFRTADALGLGGSGISGDAAGVPSARIYLAGVTPAPQDKFGRINKEIAKVALGAEKAVSWVSIKTTAAAIKKLRAGGVRIVALEQSVRSVDYKKFRVTGPTAFVIGNEVEGVTPATLNLCDDVIEIPMRGEKESLNVSVAFGIALARVLGL